MVRYLLSFLIFSVSLVSAHPADPTSQFTKYLMYGQDGITYKFKFVSPNTVGWIGSNTDVDFGNYPGGTEVSAPIYSRGTLDMSCDADFFGQINLVGNLGNDGCGTGSTTVNNDIFTSGSMTGTWPITGSVSQNDASINTKVPNLDISTLNYSVQTNANNINIAGGSSQVLTPGIYGDVTATGKLVLGEGTYEFNSITMGWNGGITISKPAGTTTRILVKNNFNFGSNDYGISLDVSGGDTYGQVLLYLENENSVTTPSGASAFALDATILAPNATVTIGSDNRLRGQILAKSIVVNNDLNLDAEAFQPFDPSGVSLVGSSSISFSEDSDANTNTRNSRLVQIPIELSALTQTQATLDYQIRPLTAGAAWATGLTSATLGTDSTNSDLVYGGTYGSSLQTSTMTFEVDSVRPNTAVEFFLVDDDLPEPGVNGIEYFEIKLFNPVNLKLEADANAKVVSDDSLVYIIPIVSEDVANQAPTDITLAVNILNERTIYSIDVTGTDSDNSANELSYSIVGGADASYFTFNNSNGQLELNSAAVYENSAGVIQDTVLTVELQVQDPSGASFNKTFNLPITNMNDEKPNAYVDFITVDEGGTETVVLSDNDNDLFDGLSLNGIYTLLGTQGGSKFGSSISISNDTLTYTHDDSENFIDTVYYVLNDGGILASNQLDTSFVIITINPLNDNTPVLGDTTITLPENSSPSDLFNLVASDSDLSSSFVYGLINGNLGNAFSISTTGMISLDSSLNFEVTPSYVLEVYAISQGDTVTARVTVNVSNINEAPVLSVVGQLSIEENTLAGTIVSGAINVVDVDSSVITWTLIDSTLFVIDPNSGVISLKNDSTLDFESQSSQLVQVLVDDGEFQDTLEVSIDILDVNDAAITADTTFMVNEGESSVGQLVSIDEDVSSDLIYTLQDSVFSIDSATGAITVQTGFTLDYETTSSYSIEIIIQDGLFSDTSTVTVTVQDMPEVSNLTIVEVYDPEGVQLNFDETITTNQDSITIVWNKEGVLDTITYSVSDGVNILGTTFKDPSKDVAASDSIIVNVNTQAPELTVVDNGVPQDSDSVYYVNDLQNDSISISVQYYDKDLVLRDSLVSVPLDEFTREGVTETYSYTFTDVFGNTSSVSVEVQLDTEAPQITILNPITGSSHDSLQVRVDWEVKDGLISNVLSDTLVMTSERFVIIKTAVDFAGNTSADTVVVLVQMEDSKSEVQTVVDLVSEKSQEDILDYFDAKDRESDPAFDRITQDVDGDGIPDSELANLSVVNKSNSSLSELQVRTANSVINRTVFNEIDLPEGTSSLQENATGLALQIDVTFPMNGGFTQDGTGQRRGGFIPDSLLAACEGDTTMYDLRINDITVHVFDHIGQYVTRITIPGVDITNTQWQGDDGVVTLLLDVPQLKDGLKSANGVNLGSGVYILNGVVQAVATPKACVSDFVNVRKSSSTILERVGYQRRDIF